MVDLLRTWKLDCLTFAMMDDPGSWRLRAIERVELVSAHWSASERSIHVKPLSEVRQLHRPLGRISGDHSSVTVVLPIAELPKATIFDLVMEVAGEPVYRLSREETARIQARYIRHLAVEAGLWRLINGRLEQLLAEIFAFDPRKLRQEVKEAEMVHWTKRHWRKSDTALDAVVSRYTSLEFGRQAPTQARLNSWESFADQINGWSLDYVIPNESRISASQNPLLAMPRFMQQTHLGQKRAGRVLENLAVLIEKAHSRLPDPRAQRLLSTYYSYGYRWQVFVECQVPLHESFEITLTDKRATSFDRPRAHLQTRNWWRDRFYPTAHYNVSFADAGTNHLHVRVSDTKVRLVPEGCFAMDEAYRIKCPSPGDERTLEFYSRYDFRGDRRERIWVAAQVQLSRTWLALHWGMIVGALAGLSLLIWLGFVCYPKVELNSSDVAAILLPVTFAGALIVVSDRTTLAMRVKRAKQGFLMSLLLVLWMVAVSLYAIGRVTIGD
ncbi:hypothetical protein ACH4YO_23395 [Streptomyces noursei]|uniref:hypothetical protein n=1 Tax=Streptomyces noursei TaxID=1971 RepID=UPI0033C30536